MGWGFRLASGGMAIARPANPTIGINALLTMSSVAMERPQDGPRTNSVFNSSVLHIIILNPLAIVVALVQPAGPIKSREIKLKTMVPIRHLRPVSGYPHLSKSDRLESY